MKMMLFKVGEPKGEILEVSANDDKRLKQMQEAVGGYITFLGLLDDYYAIVDEEGELKKKEINCLMHGNAATIPILGNILIARFKNNKFISLTESDMEFIQTRVWLNDDYPFPAMVWDRETRDIDFWNKEE